MKVTKTVDSIEALYAKYKKNNAIYDEGDLDTYPVGERLNTPFMSHHRWLGGGPAKGKVTTYSGLFSTSKTTSCLQIAGANPDAIIGFIDCEYEWKDTSYEWIKKYFNIDKDRIHVLQPSYMEEGADMVFDLCSVADIIIYDGFTSIGSAAEFTRSMEEQQMGAEGKASKKFFKKFRGHLYKTNTTLMITNHLYDAIGDPYKEFYEPGGKSLGFYPSQKLMFSTVNDYNDQKEIIGQKVRVLIEKDKITGNKGKKFELNYNNFNGFDVTKDLVNNAIELGVVEQKGSWYAIDGTNIGQGLSKIVDMFNLDSDLYAEIWDRCISKIEADKVAKIE